MHKIYLLIIISSLIGFLPSNFVRAEESDFYADSVYSASNQVYQSENSLGEPDSVSTSFFDKDAVLILDLGESEEGTGDLTIYFSLLNFGAGYRIEFMDTDLIKVQTSANTLPLSTSELTITYLGGVPYRYVSITSTEEEVWKLDAIKVSSINEIIEEEEEGEGEESATEEGETEEDTEEDTTHSSETTCEDNRGLLVKLPNDNNPETTADTIVYAMGCDGTRHLFPDELTYKTWWTNFEDVAFVDENFMAYHEAGANATIRPGTDLIKTSSDPKVYAVEPNGILRWIPSEEIATSLFGTSWNARIVDVSEDFFSDYTIGDDLTINVYPTGTIGYLSTGQVVYLEGTTYYTFAGELWSSGRFQSKFLIDLDDEIMTNYSNGGDITENDDIVYPY